MGKSWYIYGKLLHLQTPIVPVNVATHHKCINRKKLQYIVWFVTDIHWYQLDINQTSMSCVSISIRYQTVICVRIDINVHIRKNKSSKNLLIIMAIQTARLLHLWCVLILDEQWNDRKCHNSKCIASTHRLYDTTKSCFTYHVIHFISLNHMCLHEIKCMYWETMLLYLWWGDTFMVCCYIYKKPWRP